MSQSTDHEEESKEIQSKQLTIETSIKVVSKLLTDLVQSQGGETSSIFDCQEFLNIPLDAYLKRVHKYTKFSPQSLIIAVLYIDKYNMSVQDFNLNGHNVHRLILACLILAAKFQDDIYFDNCTFELAGGVCTAQLLKLQLEVYEKLQYSVFVDEEEYQNLLERLLSVYLHD